MKQRVTVSLLLLTTALGACATREDSAPPFEVTAEAAAALPSANPPAGSLWNQDPESLFGNRRARKVGDILTVIVEINDAAELDNNVRRLRQSNETLDIPALLGAPQFAANVLPGDATFNPAIDYERNRQFVGQGIIRREDVISLRLAARVVDTLPNGDLVISGQQEVRVNHETRYLQTEGVVRPEDISRDNTIAHDRIADARIRYVGRGELDQTNRPPRGSRLLDILFPL